MPLVQAKCTNCGASLQVDGTKDAAICPYCGTPFIVEKAVNYYNTTNNISANVVNIYGDTAKDFVIRGGKLEKYNGSSPDVVIPNTVSVIGGNAFKCCSALTSVEIPDSVVEIEESAFSECSRLKRINIPDSVTSIGSGAFFHCTSLTGISLPDRLEELGGELGGAFSDCTRLTSISVPASVKRIESFTFSDCHNLKYVKIPGHTVIDALAFSGCSHIEELVLGDVDIEKNYDEDGFPCFTGTFLYSRESLRKVQAPSEVLRIFARECPNINKEALAAEEAYIKNELDELNMQLKSLGLFGAKDQKNSIKRQISELSAELAKLEQRIKNA